MTMYDTFTHGPLFGLYIDCNLALHWRSIFSFFSCGYLVDGKTGEEAFVDTM